MAIDGTFNKLNTTPAALHNAVRKLVRKAAFDIQAKAMAKAPKDTGFLRSSIYTVTSTTSGYGHTLSAGEKRGKLVNLLDEVAHPISDQEAIVAVGAEYGIFVEYGTSHVPAQPYLTPALEAVAPEFRSAMSRLEDYLKDAIENGIEIEDD